MDKLELYNRYAEVPAGAQKKISGGRLNGMTDINPMWRIRCLTEAFGAQGTGWVAPVTKTEYVPGANGEVACIVTLELRYRLDDGSWSEGVQGIGGSMYVANEKSGLRTNDEAPKMAYTDALSVACKGLGIGANVYWANGRSKYSAAQEARPEGKDPQEELVCESCGKAVQPSKMRDGKTWSAADVAAYSRAHFGGRVMCLDCQKAEYKKVRENAV